MRPGARAEKPHRSARLCAALGLALGIPACLAAGCFTSSEGLEPPLATFYFPTGLVVSPGNTALYVANSDFDLQYSGGTVQALDLAALRSRAASAATEVGAAMATGADLGAACSAALGVGKNDQTLLHPGPCAPLDAAAFVRASASIGAFASGATILLREDGPGARLYVPVRGDPSITYFDIPDDRDPAAPVSTCADPLFCLDCGASSAEARCGADHRVGENPYANIRNLVLPPEPVGIAATQRAAGDPIVVAHQTEQAASLLINRWGGAERPTLEFYLTDLPLGPTEVGAVPVPAAVDWAAASSPEEAIDYRPGFLVTYRASNELTLLRYEDDALSSPARPFLSRAGSLLISENSAGNDSRGVAVDGSQRAACEAECAEGDVACGLDCLAIPLRLFIANRAPASLLVARIETGVVESDGVVTGAFDSIVIEDSVALTFGASRVELGHVVDKQGELSLRVFAVAFDSRFIFSYDPVARRVDAVIRTGRGPHDVAFDVAAGDAESGASAHAYLYVGHFTDSYVGVVDLDTRRPTFGQMLVNIGPPVPPRDSK